MGHTSRWTWAGAWEGASSSAAHNRPTWMPYVEVDDVFALTARARELGASVLLEPREGPAGWRSVVADRASGEIALWQPKG